MTSSRPIAALALAALALASCGDEADPDLAAEATTTTAEPTGTADTAGGDADDDDDDHDHDHDHDDEPDEDDHPEAPEGAVEHDDPQPRLLVSDAASGAVEVLDLTSGELLDTLVLPASAALGVSDGGRFVFAAMADDDAFAVLDAGAWTEPHGDHTHSFSADPSVLDLRVEGPSPVHITPHHGRTALFTDGDGSVHVVDEHELDHGELEVASFATGRPHHGAAVPLDDVVLTTVASDAVPEGELPDGLATYDLDGTELDRVEQACPEAHGEASLGEAVLFGCEEFIAVVSVDDEGALLVDEVPYPAPTAPNGDEAPRAYTVRTDEATDLAVSDLDDTGLLRVDPATGEATRMALPAAVHTFALDGAGHAVVVTDDGSVHVLDLTSGTVEASAPVVAPFSLDGEFSDPRPRLAVSGTRAYVADPATGTVHELATNDGLRTARTFPTATEPRSVVVVG